MSDPTSNIADLLGSFWMQFLAFITLVVWLVRGEAGTKANAAEIRRIWRQREEDLQAHKDARETTNALLDEVRKDIKTLLGRRD